MASEQGLDTSMYKRVFKPPRLKSQISFILVCIPSSRQLKKYKIFVLPGWISGNIFMPPIVAFHEIPFRDGLFKGELPDSFDKERRIYRCNEDAFYNPKSYIDIYD